MNTPARRDGTPEQDPGKTPADLYVSNARPARRQHVPDRKPPESGASGQPSKGGKKDSGQGDKSVRLQKVLAAAGVASLSLIHI